MKSLCFPVEAVVAGLALSLAACGEKPAPAKPPATIAEAKSAGAVEATKREMVLAAAMKADRDFAAMADKTGVGAAFATYMDAVEGQMIGPGEVTKGQAAIRKAFAGWPADLKLQWAPDGGYAAASDDLAVTTGRWTRLRAGAVVEKGRYVTVWRKNDLGEWRGVIDIGATDPAPAAAKQK